jgi:hypothetical protein
MHKLGNFSDNLLDRQIEEIVNAVNKLTIYDAGRGVVMRSPDGTKFFRVAVDDAGAVTTADVTADLA